MHPIFLIVGGVLVLSFLRSGSGSLAAFLSGGSANAGGGEEDNPSAALATTASQLASRGKSVVLSSARPGGAPSVLNPNVAAPIVAPVFGYTTGNNTLSSQPTDAGINADMIAAQPSSGGTIATTPPPDAPVFALVARGGGEQSVSLVAQGRADAAATAAAAPAPAPMPVIYDGGADPSATDRQKA